MNIVSYYKLSNKPVVHPAWLVKTVAATGTPEALSASSLRCTKVTIQGQKSFRTDNTSDAWLGFTGQEADGDQGYRIAPGTVHTWLAPEGACYDLSEWYLDVGTNGDGAVVYYE